MSDASAPEWVELIRQAWEEGVAADTDNPALARWRGGAWTTPLTDAGSASGCPPKQTDRRARKTEQNTYEVTAHG